MVALVWAASDLRLLMSAWVLCMGLRGSRGGGCLCGVVAGVVVGVGCMVQASWSSVLVCAFPVCM